MPQLTHYTLLTGDGRLTDRSEVDDLVIDRLRPVVREAAESDDPVALPGGFRLHLTVGFGGAMYTLFAGETPAVICGLATTEDAVAGVWPALLERSREQQMPTPDRPPGMLPWLAILILPTMANLPREIIGQLGDLERCIAWTILEWED